MLCVGVPVSTRLCMFYLRQNTAFDGGEEGADFSEKLIGGETRAVLFRFAQKLNEREKGRVKEKALLERQNTT